MKRVEAFKEEMNKSLKEIQENIVTRVKEMNKTVEDLKMQIAAMQVIQTGEILEMKEQGKMIESTDTRITHSIQEMEVRISGIEDTIEEIDTLIKENVKSKKFLTENIHEIWDERTKPKNNRNKRRRRFPGHRPRKYFQQNHRGIFL